MSNLTVITPCGAKKRTGIYPAYALYVGPYYTACLAYALSITDRSHIYILSAKHGLLSLEQKVISYNLKMGQPGSITADRVKEQAKQYKIQSPIICLGGSLYTGIAKAVWPDALTPLSGVGGIGKQLQWLKYHRGKSPEAR